MSLSVSKIPPRVHFAANALPFELTSDNLYETEGQKFFIVINRVDDIVEDETLEFEWGGNAVTITAKDSPDDSGNQVVSGASAIQFHAALSANYLLSRDFTLTLSGNEIAMEARSEGAEFDCEITINTSAFTTYSENEGISAERHPFFAVVAQVLAIDPAQFPDPPAILGTDKLTPAIEPTVVFDPAGYILPWFDYSFEFPVLTKIINWPKAICAYFIRMAEQYGSPPSVNKLTTSSVFYALPGLLADEKQLAYNQQNQSWWQQLPYTRAFMSNAPLSRLSSVYVPEKLWFLCWHAYQGPTSLRCKLYFADNDNGTSATFEASVIFMEKYKIYELNVGYIGLELQQFIDVHLPGEICTSWEVWLQVGEQIVSEVRHFIIDNRFNLTERIFLFKNSFGFCEAIRTTGKAIVKHTVSKETFYNEQPTAFDPTSRTRFTKTSDFAETLELNSGYFRDYQTAFWASEAFRSDEIFEVVNNMLVPIIVLSDDMLIRKDGEFTWAFKVEYARAFNGAVFPAPATQDIGGDFNEDYNEDYEID